MKILILLQFVGASCLYLSAWLGRKNLLAGVAKAKVYYVNSWVYPFYVIGFFLYLGSFLFNIHCFHNLACHPEIILIPFWISLSLLLLFWGLFLFFALTPIYFLSRPHAMQKDVAPNPFHPPELVVKGLFRYCRHPMALGIYSFYLGYCMLYPSAYAFISTFLGFIPAHVFFISYYEEMELEFRFGNQYLLYKKKTPFLLPRLWSAG